MVAQGAGRAVCSRGKNVLGPSRCFKVAVLEDNTGRTASVSLLRPLQMKAHLTAQAECTYPVLQVQGWQWPWLPCSRLCRKEDVLPLLFSSSGSQQHCRTEELEV
jgi:hypothetical protein